MDLEFSCVTDCFVLPFRQAAVGVFKLLEERHIKDLRLEFFAYLFFDAEKKLKINKNTSEKLFD